MLVKIIRFRLAFPWKELEKRLFETATNWCIYWKGTKVVWQMSKWRQQIQLLAKIKICCLNVEEEEENLNLNKLNLCLHSCAVTIWGLLQTLLVAMCWWVCWVRWGEGPHDRLRFRVVASTWGKLWLRTFTVDTWRRLQSCASATKRWKHAGTKKK